VFIKEVLLTLWVLEFLKMFSLHFITQGVQEGKMEMLKYVPYSHRINSVFNVG